MLDPGVLQLDVDNAMLSLMDVDPEAKPRVFADKAWARRAIWPRNVTALGCARNVAREFMMTPFLIPLAFWGTYLSWLLGKFAYNQRSRRKRAAGFEFVYVEDDGSARELDADERAYLQTEFEGGDGGRPYIKSNYESVTPDNRLSGFLSRRQLPQEIRVKPASN